MERVDYNKSQFDTVDDIVRSMLIREDKLVQDKNRLKYKEIAPDVFRQLNLSSIKQTKRVILNVDPQMGFVVKPGDFYDLSTLSGVDRHGRVHPLCINTNPRDKELVDLGGKKDCDCECGCADVLCARDREYELIQEEVMARMPNGDLQSFIKSTRKRIDRNGGVYIEITEPTANYTSSVHTSTTPQTVTRQLCQVEVKKCGCVLDTHENRELWKRHVSAIYFREDHPDRFFYIDCEYGLPSETYFSPAATYSMPERSNRIEFPSNFMFKKILMRYYASLPTKEILVPKQAKKAMMSGIKYEAVKWDGSDNLAKWAGIFNNDVNDLNDSLHRLQLNEIFAYLMGHNNSEELYGPNFRLG